MASEHSKVCLNLPPPVPSGYIPKGQYCTTPGSGDKVAGLDVYLASPSNPTARATILIYDAFGLHPSTLQGADRLAESLQSLVLVPDFFQGAALPFSILPADTEEKKERMQAFWKEHADIPTNLELLGKVREEAGQRWAHVKHWGVFGLCWGGKLASMASEPDTKFSVSGTAHPGRLDVEEARKMAIPHICLFSKKDGEPEVVEAYAQVLRANEQNEVDSYPTMHHGWMGARANLEDSENVKEFERGYNQVAAFFSKHLYPRKDD